MAARWVLGGGALVLAALVLGFAVVRPVQVLPRLALSPGFTLVAEDGQPLTSESLRGQIVLYHFTYTGCQPPCPQTLPLLRELRARLDALGNAAPPVVLVTISFDPERDRPEVLRATAAALGADPAGWRFATAEPSRIRSVVGGGFHTYFAPTANGGFTFDPVFVLVDGWGIVRAEYRMGIPRVETLLRDITLVREEVVRSTGVARYAYEAAHLFACYPR